MVMDNHPAAYMSMGLTAERVAKHYDISREEADQFALGSHQKALAAIEAGRFEDEIVPVPVSNTVMTTAGKLEKKEKPFSVDEGRGPTPRSRRWGSYARSSMPPALLLRATAPRCRMAQRPR